MLFYNAIYSKKVSTDFAKKTGKLSKQSSTVT
jgi:hypothetical protein